MSEYSEIKRLAARIVEVQTSQDVPISKLFDDFDAATSPEVILALIAENDRLERENQRVNASWHGMKRDFDQLKAENWALRKALTECSDSLHGEMLQKFGGQLPDDMHPVTRREYDRDMAEVAGYRAAMGNEAVE